MLNTITHGSDTRHPGLLMAHGLYGSARNWGVIAKRLSDDRQVTAVDMRNHGDSPRTTSHSYPDMAEDLAKVIDSGGAPCHVMGHSMGGKAAMVLALTRPDLVHSLIVADIAPVPYSHSQLGYAETMRDTDLSGIERRSDVAERLAPRIDNPDLVPFFLQSVDVQGQRWKLNLDTLISEMPTIMGFPDISGSYDGPTLFLTGADSDYVRREDRDRITALFPAARFVKIPDAGHWLHADKPREFEAALRAWLDRQDTRATT